MHPKHKQYKEKSTEIQEETDRSKSIVRKFNMYLSLNGEMNKKNSRKSRSKKFKNIIFKSLTVNMCKIVLVYTLMTQILLNLIKTN